MPHIIRFTLAVVLVASSCACQSAAPKSMTSEYGLTMTEAELRENIALLRAQIAGEFETLANSMIIETDDPEQRSLAVALKIRVNEEVIRATMHPDPAVSLIDLWALTLQIRDFAETEEIIETYGQFYPGFVDSIERVHDAIILLATRLIGDDERFAITETSINEYVAEHPLTGRLWRPSPAPLLAAYRERTGGGVFGDVKSLDSGVDEISHRLDIMTTQLPKQIIWHTDLLIQSRLGDFGIADLPRQIQQVTDTLDQVPDEIERHRVETLADIDRQRRETIDALDAEVDETMSQISEQREQTLADLDRQRLETLDHIDATTSRSLEQISSQRVDTLDRFDDMVEGVMANLNTQRDETIVHLETLTADAFQETDAIMSRAINTLFIRLVILLVIAFVAGVVVVIIWRRVGT